jgi:outer membrane protein
MKTITMGSALALALASSSALAYDNTMRLGYGYISVSSKASNFTTNGPAFLTPQPASFDVGDASTVIASFSRRLNEKWDLEFAGGLPPKHEVKGTGTLEEFGVISNVKQLAPTVFANYKFGAEGSKFRPFFGLGVNYTTFIGRQSTESGNLASGGPTRIDLKSSVGLAGQVGVSYQYKDRWTVVANIATARVTSDLTATTGNIQRKSSINFRPVLFALTTGYSF